MLYGSLIAYEDALPCCVVELAASFRRDIDIVNASLDV